MIKSSTHSVRSTRSRGFTLLELMVAISVFAILAAMSYSGLNNVLNMKARTEAQSDRLVDLQRAFTFMARDIQQAIDRNVRDEYGTQLDPMIGNSFGEYIIELSRTGWRNPADFARSNIQRVVWSVKEETLVRGYWTALDRAQDTPLLEQKMLTDVEEVALRFMDENNEWRASWPKVATATTSLGTTSAPARLLPKAVEVTLKHKYFGTIQRLFAVPG